MGGIPLLWGKQFSIRSADTRADEVLDDDDGVVVLCVCVVFVPLENCKRALARTARVCAILMLLNS